MESYRGRKEGNTGRESRCTLINRMQQTSCVISSEDKRISQQSVSLSNRLGYLTRQIGPIVAVCLAAELGLQNRDFDTSVILTKACLPQFAMSSSLEYQYSRIHGVSNIIHSAGWDTSCRKMMSGDVDRFWTCERMAEIRASGAEELESIFHVISVDPELHARLL